MTNIGHFRAAGELLEQYKGQIPTRLWVAPPTKMDAAKLIEEGYYNIFGKKASTTRQRKIDKSELIKDVEQYS